MSEQLCLFDRPTMLDFLFFAFVPAMGDSVRIADARERLRHEHGLTGHLIHCNLLHISLHPVGEYHGLPDRVVEEAMRAGAKMSMRPFEIMFDRAMSFDRKRSGRPFVLRTVNDAALMEFYRALGEAMRHVGLRRGRSRFTPHMTMLYDDSMVRERSIEVVRWIVHDLVLVHSLRGRGHSQHVHLARWPLRGEM